MKPVLLLLLFLVAVSYAFAEKPYDFRTTAAYAKLSTADRQRLEQVHHDQVLILSRVVAVVGRAVGEGAGVERNPGGTGRGGGGLQHHGYAASPGSS